MKVEIERSTLFNWLEHLRLVDTALMELEPKSYRLATRQHIWHVQNQIFPLINVGSEETEQIVRDGEIR